jgi:hypothetical protein
MGIRLTERSWTLLIFSCGHTKAHPLEIRKARRGLGMKNRVATFKTFLNTSKKR